MSKKKTGNLKELPKWTYLIGPLALTIFFVMQLVCGNNFPGYDFFGNSIYDLVALDSYCIIMSAVFFGIFILFTVFSSVQLIFHFKNNFKAHKILHRGVVIVMAACLAFCVSFGFLQDKAGDFAKPVENVKQMYTLSLEQGQSEYDAKVAEIEGTSTESSDSSSSSSSTVSSDTSSTATTDSSSTTSSDTSSTSSSSSSTTVTDNSSAIQEQQEQFVESFSDWKVICHWAIFLITILLGIVGLVLVAVGGFKDPKQRIAALLAILFVAIIIASIVAVIAADFSYFGLLEKHMLLFIPWSVALAGAYCYITAPKVS